MSANDAAQQKLADDLASVLRKYEREGGCIDKLAGSVGDNIDARDLRRWASGTKIPGHVLFALLAELPRHLADTLLSATGLRLVARDPLEDANSLLIAAKASAFAGNIAARHSDGKWCHVDRSKTAEEARRLIADLEALVEDGE